jgi:hypothetical protein
LPKSLAPSVTKLPPATAALHLSTSFASKVRIFLSQSSTEKAKKYSLLMGTKMHTAQQRQAHDSRKIKLLQSYLLTLPRQLHLITAQ